MPKVNPDTYLRKLPYGVIKQLSNLLDPHSTLGRNWKALASAIPNKRSGTELKYSQLDIQRFETELYRPGGSPTAALLQDWGTQNATAQDLVDVLLESDLESAAEVVLPEYVRNKTHQQQESQQFTAPESENIPRWEQPSSTPNTSHLTQTQQSQQPRPAPPLPPRRPATISSKSTTQALERLPHSTSAQNSDVVSSTRDNEKTMTVPGGPQSSSSSSLKSSSQSRSQTDNANEGLLPGMTVSLEPIVGTRSNEGSSDSMDTGDNNTSGLLSNEERAEASAAVSEAKEALQSESCAIEMPLEEVSRQTNNFNDDGIREGGNRIGEGAFGTVYRGQRDDGKMIAVKKLKEATGAFLSRSVQQFKTEVEVLSRCQHVNLVGLNGYCCDGHIFCLIYDYMPNGSLQDRLMCKDGTPPLEWQQRLTVCRDVARGICYLHSQNLIHRDIKSANVLLDENFVGKVGDFGLVRLGPDQNERTHIVTETVIGTRAYMPMEAFQGIISDKLDTYSYGVVLLEVMTGLPVYDESRESLDLRTHIDENCDSNEEFLSLVDTSLTCWDDSSMTGLFDIAQKCFVTRRKRPLMQDVLSKVESLLS